VSAFFIIDTNVVVAGLLMAHADSPVARILDGMLRASFPFVVSQALLAEYRTVLVRPKLLKLHGLSEAEIDVILTDLARHAIVLAAISNEAATLAPDSGDQFLWNLLATRADLVLVTGDKRLLQDAAMQRRVILPITFLAQLQH
jgi:uncharacterized protein